MRKINNTVMFACNQGGHFSQMMALSCLFEKYDSILVTDNLHATIELPALRKVKCIEYALGMAKMRNDLDNKKQAKKNRWQSLRGYISLIWECHRIWKKHHPAVIVSTGSNIAVGLFLYGKIRGSKLIFIETRARVYGKTITGRIVERIADQIFVQWPEMLKFYPNAKYFGTLV